jgi:hypothetical protein
VRCRLTETVELGAVMVRLEAEACRGSDVLLWWSRASSGGHHDHGLGRCRECGLAKWKPWSSEVALMDKVAHGESLVLGLVMKGKQSMASGPTSGGRGF